MLLPLILSTSLLSSQAEAAKNGSGLFMWAAGATASTIILPSYYPIQFPKAKDENDPSPRDNLDHVKGDMGLAARGMIYINNDHRIGMRLHRGFGFNDGKYGATIFTLEYDKNLLREGPIGVFLGGGIGLGGLKYDQGSDGGTLKTNTYNFRAQIAIDYFHRRGNKAANTPDDFGYELAFFISPIGFHGPETYEFGDTTLEDPVGGGISFSEDNQQEIKNGLYNPYFGVEFTFFWGDLTPPANGGGGKKDKKKKRNRG